MSGIPGPDACRFMQREAEPDGDYSTEAPHEMWQALKEEEQKKLKAERYFCSVFCSSKQVRLRSFQ